MAVAAPSERVYYYECSYGRFRLTCFIPPGELKRLSEENSISKDAVKDFPDGVDLGCTEADYRNFETTYGYRFPLDPGALRRAFYAILSSTRNWKIFHGSGDIPAADLERHVDAVDKMLSEKELIPEEIKFDEKPPPLKKRRKIRRSQVVQQKQAQRVLQQLHVERIDSGKTLTQQVFSQVDWLEGEKAGDVFMRLHQKQREKE